MNKQSFLNELDHYLRKIPDIERKDILNDFKEHFEDGGSDGKTEERVAEELGNPKIIGRELLADYTINVAEKDKSLSNITRAIIAAVGLSFLNLIFLLGPIVVVLSLYVSLVAIGIGFALTPLGWMVSLLTGQVDHVIAEFFATVTISSFGVLVSIGMFYLGKFLYRIILSYIKINIRIVKG